MTTAAIVRRKARAGVEVLTQLIWGRALMLIVFNYTDQINNKLRGQMTS
jgi:hypothetical protein